MVKCRIHVITLIDVRVSVGKGGATSYWEYVLIDLEGKREPREKRPRPERKNEYEYNADLIDENTVIPPLPKKN